MEKVYVAVGDSTGVLAVGATLPACQTAVRSVISDPDWVGVKTFDRDMSVVYRSGSVQIECWAVES